MTETSEIIDFIKRFSFGTIVTQDLSNRPVATHLPFIIDRAPGQLLLTAHFARANEQWKSLENNKNVLVIFQEPHAYISPTLYEKKLNVPTWNYIAVHLYGKAALITDEQAVLKTLEQTITNYEPAYKEQYDALPADYKLKMSKGIVAFSIEVNEIQGKKKISQNKSRAEQERIIQVLSKNPNSTEALLAAYMQRELKD